MQSKCSEQYEYHTYFFCELQKRDQYWDTAAWSRHEGLRSNHQGKLKWDPSTEYNLLISKLLNESGVNLPSPCELGHTDELRSCV